MIYVTTAALARITNPYVDYPWAETGDISRPQIAKCLAENKLAEQSYHPARGKNWKVDGIFHAERIAYLVKFKDDTPLQLDLPIPVLDYYPETILVDGNHRLAAAIYRKDLWVPIEFGGQDSEFERLFLLTKQS